MTDQPNSNLPWAEQFRIVAKKWVEADAAASLLEDTRSARLSQMMLAFDDNTSMAKREMIVKASEEWMAINKEISDARKGANMLRVQKEYIDKKFHEWNSMEASQRAEMKLTR